MFHGMQNDWRSEILSKVRALIKQADPDSVEEMKWKKATNPDGVPVWSDNGIICTGETYKDHIRLTFFKGGLVKDPKGLFTSPQGATRRSMEFYEKDKID